MELEWCSDKGIPHSELLGWSDDDRSKLMAHLLERNSRCSHCGTAGWEWAEDRRAYHPETYVCQGCYMLDVAKEDDGGDRTPGSRIVLVPKGGR